MPRKRIVDLKVLPGEPLNGAGRVCIHLFVQDGTSLHVEPHALHPVYSADGKQVKQKVEARPARGRLACDPNKPLAPVTRGNFTTVTLRTDDPQAVTCARCMATKDYTVAMERLRELTNV